MKKDTIEIPRAWLESLIELGMKTPMSSQELHYLLGYIASAESLLK